MFLWGVFASGVCCKLETWLFNQYNIFYRVQVRLEFNPRSNGRFWPVLWVVWRRAGQLVQLLHLKRLYLDGSGN